MPQEDHRDAALAVALHAVLPGDRRGDGRGRRPRGRHRDQPRVRALVVRRLGELLGDGERRPQNPGHPAPRGWSLYARLGGVYPLALFVDRLIDALLSNRAVKIPLDARRTAGSLKYLFTELVCVLAGGPETMTSPMVRDTLWMLQPCKHMISCMRPHSHAGES